VYDLQIPRITSTQTKEEKRIMKDSKLKVAPITVGNPVAAASLSIDQSHLEEFVSAEERSSVVECKRPPKGVFFTVRAETPGEPWKDRAFYFLLELEGRDPYIVAPAIAKAKEDEDVIRPVLLVRYVTMAGEEGLWLLKINRSDAKSNPWNTSALNILDIAASGKWVRIVSMRKHYRHSESKKNLTKCRHNSQTARSMIWLTSRTRTRLSLRSITKSGTFWRMEAASEYEPGDCM
jgi:hypothetical protein